MKTAGRPSRRTARPPQASSPLTPDSLFDQGAKLAREYFVDLTIDPESADLAEALGYSVGAADGDDGLKGFGETLQPLLVTALQQRHSPRAEADRGDDRDGTASTLRDALRKLANARDTATAIEKGVGAEYFLSGQLGQFVRLVLEEGGAELEQALCDLGAIDETKCGYFVHDLKRRSRAPER